MNSTCHHITPQMIKTLEIGAFPNGADTITRINLLDGEKRFATLSPDALDVLIAQVAADQIFLNNELCGGIGANSCFEVARNSRMCSCAIDDLTAETLLSIIFSDKN